MVQRRAARYCTNRYHNTSSVTDMLQDLNWETLESRRIKPACNDIQDHQRPSGHTFWPYLTPATTQTRAHHLKKLSQYPARTDTFKYSFFPRIIPVWNSRPASVAEAPDLVLFKQGLSHSKLGRGQSGSRIGGFLELCRLGDPYPVAVTG